MVYNKEYHRKYYKEYRIKNRERINANSRKRDEVKRIKKYSKEVHRYLKLKKELIGFKNICNKLKNLIIYKRADIRLLERKNNILKQKVKYLEMRLYNKNETTFRYKNLKTKKNARGYLK